MKLASPVHPASVAVFRIAFGLILLWEVVRYFQAGWIAEYFLDPEFHFRYRFFEWLEPWPGRGMELHFLFIGACALGIALGWRTRWCALGFVLSFGMVFLLEQARYLNHFYLVLLFGALLVIVPAGNAYSLDARRRGARPVPRWSLELLRFQVGIVYFYAAVAKMNPDWLQGEPLGMWLAAAGEATVFGAWLQHPLAPWLLSYGGLLLDLLAWPLLVRSRTRPWMFALVAAFHCTNSHLFGIGIFPALALSATTIFFAPDWPVRWFPGFARQRFELKGAAPARGGSWKVVVAVWVGAQVLLPLRHFAYPSCVHWSEEGHAFAWHMKLRSKRAEAVFRLVDQESGRQRWHDPRGVLTDWQYRKMAARPDMILQYAHHLAREEREQGRRVAVHAEVEASLNGRPAARLIDPEVDLAAVRPSFAPAPWILPFEQTWDRGRSR